LVSPSESGTTPITSSSEIPQAEGRPVANADSPYHPVPSRPEPSAAQPAAVQVERSHYPPATTTSDLIPVAAPPVIAANPPVPEDPAPPSPKPEEKKAKQVEDPPLLAALRYYMNKQPAQAVACLQVYGRPAQDLLLRLLPLIVRLTEPGELRDPAEAVLVTAQLDEVKATLQPRVPLVISKMCLVDSIKDFGYFIPMPEDHALHAHDYVQIYAELENFTTERQDSFYCIRTDSRIEICEFNGRKRWESAFPHEANQPDLSKTARHDFFIKYSFTLPPLPPGPYTLRLHITDVATKRRATRTLDFRVAPPQSTRMDW